MYYFVVCINKLATITITQQIDKMNKTILITALLFSLVTHSQEDSTVVKNLSDTISTTKTTNFLGNTDSLTFDNSKYSLVWSSNPMQGYYKQEYLLDSTTIEDYNEMILVEALKGKISPKVAAELKVNELVELKKNNPVINWNVYENKDERIIDFVITDGATQYEWNLYRYSVLKNSDGQKYLVLYAYSYKDTLYTNEDLKPFFNRILENRNLLIAALGEFKLPEFEINE